MARLHRISLNDQEFTAHPGQKLLDAALVAGVDIPHDCRAGRCGACLTTVRAGITLGGESHQSGVVHACQARVFSDLAVAVESLPPVRQIEARLIRLVDRSADVVELTIALRTQLHILPGQFCRFTFRGYPARLFSPTAPLTGHPPDGRIRLNVKRVNGGRVSPDLGTAIQRGHHVTVEGPYGHAFLRTAETSRLVLAASGTGFAPIWAVGHAALCENPHRSVVIIAGARELKQLYMAPALEFASRFPNVEIILTVENQQAAYPGVRTGRPADHIPPLGPDNIVYAAGAPRSVDAIGQLASAAGAKFYADPFEAAGVEVKDWIARAADWLRAG